MNPPAFPSGKSETGEISLNLSDPEFLESSLQGFIEFFLCEMELSIKLPKH